MSIPPLGSKNVAVNACAEPVPDEGETNDADGVVLFSKTVQLPYCPKLPAPWLPAALSHRPCIFAKAALKVTSNVAAPSVELGVLQKEFAALRMHCLLESVACVPARIGPNHDPAWSTSR